MPWQNIFSHFHTHSEGLGNSKKKLLMSTISIEGMKFHAYHGCIPEEQVTGNTFIVDLYIETDTTKAEESDDLNDTIDYAAVYLLIKQEMQIPSKLIENAGRRILNSVKAKFPEVESAKVKVKKLNPPIEGQIESVSIGLSV